MKRQSKAKTADDAVKATSLVSRNRSYQVAFNGLREVFPKLALARKLFLGARTTSVSYPDPSRLPAK